VEYGPLVEAGDIDTTCERLVEGLWSFVERWPTEWWLWPYVLPSPRSRGGD
jgi:hypothetical protein